MLGWINLKGLLVEAERRGRCSRIAFHVTRYPHLRDPNWLVIFEIAIRKHADGLPHGARGGIGQVGHGGAIPDGSRDSVIVARPLGPSCCSLPFLLRNFVSFCSLGYVVTVHRH